MANVGFLSCDILLVLYCGIRYHLKKWEQVSLQYAYLLLYNIFLLKYSHFRLCDARELFNLCHAKLHNVIEHIFGVSKHCFKILNIAPEYPFKIQCKLPPALCALHNFIQIQDPLDDAYNAYNLNYVSYS